MPYHSSITSKNNCQKHIFFLLFSLRYYKRSEKNHRLLNVPYVDNSYKWSGGGFLSNTEDLVVFGNEMLKSYQSEDGL